MATLSEPERALGKVEAKRRSKRGEVIGYIGLSLAIVSLSFVIASARKREPAWRSLTFALLFVYLMSQLLLV